MLSAYAVSLEVVAFVEADALADAEALADAVALAEVVAFALEAASTVLEEFFSAVTVSLVKVELAISQVPFLLVPILFGNGSHFSSSLFDHLVGHPIST